MRNDRLKWLKEIKANELPEPYDELARVIGVDAIIELVWLQGGSRIYLPKITSLQRMIRDKKIREEYLAGASYSDLANEYGITERQIKTVIAKNHRKA